MNFLSPWFLLGGAAIAGPILFHLIRRAAKDRIDFSSLMFLRPTPPKAVRRRKIEHFWLLLLRCLCLLLLAIGFARPFFAHDITPPGASAGERRMILLVDTSASMRREGMWDKARAAAAEYLDKTELNDQVTVMTFDIQPQTIVSFSDWASWPSGNRAALARQRLETVTPGWKGTQLGLALTEAANLFRQNTADRRELVLITDLQEGAKLNGLQGYQWPEGTRVIPKIIAAKKRSNAGLEILEPPAAVSGVEDAIHVRIANSSDSKMEKFQLGWQGGGEPMDVYLTPGQTRTFTAPNPVAATASGALKLTGGDLEYGSLSYYAAPDVQRVAIYVAGVGLTNDTSGLAYYMQRALPSSPRWQAQLSPELTEQTVFGVVAEDLPNSQLPAMRTWLEDGKTALLVLTSGNMGPTLAALLNLPSVQLSEAPGEFALLGSVDFQHPLFKPFDDPRFSDFTHIHFWKHRHWNIPAAVNARVLARFDDGDPALADVPVGKGHLLVLASGWSPSDSQLAVSSKFPPLLETMLDWSGASAPVRTQFRTGDAIPAPASAGQIVAWTHDNLTTNLPAGVAFTATDKPGLYKAAWTGHERYFAVNVPLEESRTAVISLDELARLGVPLGLEPQLSAQAVQVRQRHLQNSELENRQKLWRWLIVGALAVTLGEIALGGWLARRAVTMEAAT